MKGNPMSKKTLVSAAVAVTALSVVLSGCSSDPAGGNGNTSLAGDITGKITVWDGRWDADPSWKAVLQAADTKFAADHPGVQVEHVGLPGSTQEQQIRTAFQAGKGADVILESSGYNGILQYADKLTPLTAQINPEAFPKVQGWELVRKKYATSGEVYGAPYGLQSYVLFYNKAIFRRAGLDPEAAPTSYAALLDAAKKLKAAGITAFGGANKEGAITGWWLSFMGTGTLSADDTLSLALSKQDADAPGIRTASQQYADLMPYTDPAYLSTSLQSLAATFDSFAKGKVAMAMGLGCCVKDVVGSLPAEDVGVVTSLGAGSNTKGNYQSAGPDESWMVPQYSTNKATATAYVKYLLGAEVQGNLYTKAGYLPNNFEVQPGTGGSKGAVQAKLFQAYLGGRTLNGIHAMWPGAVEDEYQRQMQVVLAGRGSLENALSAVKAKQKVTKAIAGD